MQQKYTEVYKGSSTNNLRREGRKKKKGHNISVSLSHIYIYKQSVIKSFLKFGERIDS